MPKRPVHWHEGMFLMPHHFQAAERFTLERIRESEDWHHPHDWGLKSVRFDDEAIANGSLVIRACQARFKDGSTVTVPDEVSLDPLDLRPALASSPEVIVHLAVPTLLTGRSNIVPHRMADGPRFFVSAVEWADENTGSDEESLEFRSVHARLLTDADITGYETLPVARIRRSPATDSLTIDPAFIPPILGMDAWPSLHEGVLGLHQHLRAWITQEADQLVGRKVSFDNQVLGDSERIMRLASANTAYSALQAVLATRGLHPSGLYQELCRLVGQLSIFSETRRPIELPTYDHDNIGPPFAQVMAEIRRLLPGGTPTFEKRYFQLEHKSFQVHLDPEWTLDTSRLYLGVETTELTDAECDELMKATDWKLASAEQVSQVFVNRHEGLKMKPLNRIPPALPAGVVYFEIDRSPAYWGDVVRTRTLGLRFRLEGIRFRGVQMLTLVSPRTQRTVNLQFAVYHIKNK